MTLRTWYPRHIVATLALMAAGFGCSSGQGVTGSGGSNGGGGGAGTAGVVGSWTGTYKLYTPNSNGGTTLADSHTLTAQFASNTSDNTGGTYTITLSDLANTAETGTFAVLGTNSIQLTATQSNISTIGGVMQYELLGPMFKLYTDSVFLQMAPSGGSTPGTTTGGTPPPPPAAQDAVYGNWVCTDSVGNQWKAALQSDNSFRIDVLARGTDLWMDGTLAITRGQPGSDADAVLTVSTSANPTYNGIVLRMNVAASSTAMTLRRMQAGAGGGAPTVAESIPCSKK